MTGWLAGRADRFIRQEVARPSNKVRAGDYIHNASPIGLARKEP